MESSEDGQIFIKNLAHFVRTHERALANALQLQRQKRRGGKDAATPPPPTSSSTTTISLAQAVYRPYLAFVSQNIRPAKLTLTPHHLFYLLSKFEDLGVDVGPLTVRLENLNADAGPSNYVSFLGHAPKSRGRQSDADSLRSVSSVRSVVSTMSSVWSNLTGSTAKAEKQLAQHRDDLRYLYSAFTKIPALRLSPDHRAKLVSGFEEFPFDTAVPLFVFKNVSSLEICDLDFRLFHGWHRVSEQLRSLTVKRAAVDDPIDLLRNIVLDDEEKRRKRSSKAQIAPPTPSTPEGLARSVSAPCSPFANALKSEFVDSSSTSRRGLVVRDPATPAYPGTSPPPLATRHSYLPKAHTSRSAIPKYRRSSGSSESSQHDMTPRQSTTDLLSSYTLSSSKWYLLRHLSLSENGLTSLNAGSLAPVANSLQSLDLSGNLFSEIPDELSTLTHLRALNLSNCMLDSLSSLSRSPLPAITTLNLRSNRLLSLAGIERLRSLERLDLRDNRLHDPTELARLTGMPDMTDVYCIKNPFTRTHANYRITIFNVFRLSPGRQDDVTIDNLGPASHERKQLNDQVPELANRPVIKQLADEDYESHTTSPGLTPVEQQLSPAKLTEPHRETTYDTTSRVTATRKKTPRKRVVELAQPDRSPAAPSEAVPGTPHSYSASVDPQTPLESHQVVPSEASTSHDSAVVQSQSRSRVKVAGMPNIDTSGPAHPNPEVSEEDSSAIRALESLGLDSDSTLYRHKIEALKTELGPSWLSALEQSTAQALAFRSASRPSTLQRDHSHRGIQLGGRTLG